MPRAMLCRVVRLQIRLQTLSIQPMSAFQGKADPLLASLDLRACLESRLSARPRVAGGPDIAPKTLFSKMVRAMPAEWDLQGEASSCVEAHLPWISIPTSYPGVRYGYVSLFTASN